MINVVHHLCEGEVMKISKSVRCMLVSAFALTLTVNCGGNEVEPAETTSTAASSSDSQSDEEQSSESENLLVSVLADELMNDPEIGGSLSHSDVSCRVAVTTMGIEGLSDLDSPRLRKMKFGCQVSQRP